MFQASIDTHPSISGVRPLRNPGGFRQTLFGVDVGGEPDLENEAELPRARGIQRHRLVLWTLGAALGASLSFSVLKSSELYAAKLSARAERQRAEELESRWKAVAAQKRSLDQQVTSLEADKAHLVEMLAEKSSAYAKLEAKLSKARHKRSRSRRAVASLR